MVLFEEFLMSDRKPPSGEMLYRGPKSAPRDKRERERDRQVRAPERESRPANPRPPLREQIADVAAHEHAVPRAPREQRMYGLNACLAVFAKRPESLRKVWLLESRIPKLKSVLAFCVKHRLGYTVVEDIDLERLSGSAHHEGVCFGVLPAEEMSLSGWLDSLPKGPVIALWLDGVGNPHNLGAMMRSAAHFGAAGVLLPQHSDLAMSGAAARVAEGAAESVPMVRLGDTNQAIAQLASAGFGIAATLVRSGTPLYGTKLPERLVLVMGAEQIGVAADLAKSATLRLGIPGSGSVESLNVSAATAVFLGEWWRQHHAIKPSH
jgi:TrmH RNA methyltransferase